MKILSAAAVTKTDLDTLAADTASKLAAHRKAIVVLLVLSALQTVSLISLWLLK